MQYYNAPGKQHDTPPHSFNMAEGRRRKFTAAEAVELIWADEDSGNENFDCGSDVESLSKLIKTTWICKGCPGQPGLCVEKDCFEIYHTKFDITQ